MLKQDMTIDSFKSGATASVVYEDKLKKTVYIANAGDSKIVWFREKVGDEMEAELNLNESDTDNGEKSSERFSFLKRILYGNRIEMTEETTSGPRDNQQLTTDGSDEDGDLNLGLSYLESIKTGDVHLGIDNKLLVKETIDHNPLERKERDRIESCGGWVGDQGREEDRFYSKTTREGGLNVCRGREFLS